MGHTPDEQSTIVRDIPVLPSKSVINRSRPSAVWLKDSSFSPLFAVEFPDAPLIIRPVAPYPSG